MTTPGYCCSRAALIGLALVALGFGGCAGGLPRLDPSGRGVFVVEPPTGSSSVTTIPPPPTGAAAPGCAPIVTLPTVMTPAPPLPTIPVPGPPVVLSSPPEVVLQLAPTDTIAPVGSEVILVASVFGSQQVLQPRQRIEWTMAPSGVGHIATISQRSSLGWLLGGAGGAEKIDADYAISSTATRNYLLNRGTAATIDDLPITAGQTWVSVSSPVEGISHVTALAPQLGAWEARQRTARIYWVDAQWSFPPSSAAPTGGRHALTTSLLRLSDRTALTGYRVRYSIAGGATASFGASDGQSIELETNAQGEATVDIGQSTAALGTTEVRVDVIRPDSLDGFDGRTLNVATGVTRVTWSGVDAPIPQPPPYSPPAQTPAEPATPPSAPAGPQIQLSVSNPPAASVGDAVSSRVIVSNLGATATGPLVVRDVYEPGLAHELESTDPDLNTVERDLASIPPGQSSEFVVNFSVRSAGNWGHTVSVYGANDALLASQQGNVLATDLGPAPNQTPYEPPATDTTPPAVPDAPAIPQAGKLSVEITGPASGVTGEEHLFNIKVTNSGDTEIHDVVVLNRFDAGLIALQLRPSAHRRVGEDIEWTALPSLAAGASKSFAVKYRCGTPGNSVCSYVTVTCREAVRADDQACMAIRAAATRLSAVLLETRDPVTVGRQAVYEVRVTNDGASADSNVRVSVILPAELTAVPAGTAGPGGVNARIVGNQVQFEPLAEIRPQEPVSFRVAARAVQVGAAKVTAEITSAGLAQPLIVEIDMEAIAGAE